MSVRRLVQLGLACAISGVAAAQSTSPAVDSVIGRAQQYAAENDSSASRRVLDSLIASAQATPLERAEATYWLARFAASAADRERTLGLLIVDFPFSPRISAALYELGMLELAHSDRDRAATHLTRFLSSTPEDSNRVSASLTLGKILLERGDLPRGCAVLLVGRGEVPESAIEIRNQFEFAVARCRGVDTTAVKPSPPAPDTVPAVRKTGAFTVQVAAYDQKAPAERLATMLRGQGLEARVVGTVKPFRVRVGRYATRADAEAASHRIDAIAKSKSFVVVAGPEDP
jgi:hypothetical protein